jgi:hypothetical protein
MELVSRSNKDTALYPETQHNASATDDFRFLLIQFT